MLTIRIKGNDVRHTGLGGYVVEPCLERSPLSEIKRVLENTGPSLPGYFRTVVGAAIVDAHYVFEVFFQAGNHRSDDLCLVEEGDDYPAVSLDGARRG